MVNQLKQYFVKMLLVFSVAALLALAMSAPLQAANTNIKVSTVPEEIYENESFNLIFRTAEEVDGAPDFSPLDRDFTITSQMQRNDFKIFSGDFERSDNWVVELIPDKAGKFSIPAIAFGKDLSPSLDIIIKPADENAAGSENGFLSELVVSHENVHVKSQIIVTKRLLSTHRIARPSFSDLKASGVDVVLERLNEGKSLIIKRGDTSYHALEIHYALYPQQAGELTLEPNVAVAQVAAGKDATINPLMNNAITKRAASNPVMITVQPVPASFTTQNWLPASDVQLTEEWPERNVKYQVGEPLTRTLSIAVKGQGFAKIPSLPIVAVDHLKRYPDNPVRNDVTLVSGINGTIITREVMIPTQAGDYELPAIEMPWWNTETNSQSVATIPSRRITVEGSIDTVTQPKAEQYSEIDSAGLSILRSKAERARALLWLSIFLGMGWVSTILLWADINRSRRKRFVASATAVPRDLYQAGKTLKQACDSGQGRAIEAALLAWGKIIFEDSTVTSLGSLGQRAGEPLRADIKKLEAALYDNNNHDWDAASIWESSLKVDHKFKPVNTDSVLEPLHKLRTG